MQEPYSMDVQSAWYTDGFERYTDTYFSILDSGESYQLYVPMYITEESYSTGMLPSLSQASLVVEQTEPQSSESQTVVKTRRSLQLDPEVRERLNSNQKNSVQNNVYQNLFLMQELVRIGCKVNVKTPRKFGTSVSFIINSIKKDGVDVIDIDALKEKTEMQIRERDGNPENRTIKKYLQYAIFNEIINYLNENGIVRITDAVGKKSQKNSNADQRKNITAVERNGQPVDFLSEGKEFYNQTIALAQNIQKAEIKNFDLECA